MHISSFACLVILAVLEGVIGHSKHVHPGTARSISCDCNINKGLGCTLGEPAEQDHACRCTLDGDITSVNATCNGELVACDKPALSSCNTTGTDYEHCMQGVYGELGNCCGYLEANCPVTREMAITKCSCEFNPELQGCILDDPNPAGRACQCKIVDGNNCTAEVVDCADPDSPDCINSGTSFSHCMQGVRGGKGNCCGYRDFYGHCTSECSCEFNPELQGCILSEPNPAGRACQCTLAAGNICIAEEVECGDSTSSNCTEPGTTFSHCMLGVRDGKGNCCGYKYFNGHCTSENPPRTFEGLSLIINGKGAQGYNQEPLDHEGIPSGHKQYGVPLDFWTTWRLPSIFGSLFGKK